MCLSKWSKSPVPPICFLAFLFHIPSSPTFSLITSITFSSALEYRSTVHLAFELGLSSLFFVSALFAIWAFVPFFFVALWVFFAATWGSPAHGSLNTASKSNLVNSFLVDHRFKKMIEGNKDQAEKAMAEAEERYRAGDLTSAYRLADKASQLYPWLPYIRNLLHSLHILRVYSNGPLFGAAGYWHAILGSKCGDDVNAIKRQYKKMCILIHPDKNPSAPAVEAFKALNMAWEALSSSTSEPVSASSASGGFHWGAPSSSVFSNGRANAQSESKNPASGSGFYSGAAHTSTANAPSGAAASGYWANAGPSGANAQAEPGPNPGCRTSSARTGGNARAQSNPHDTSAGSDPNATQNCPQCNRVCWRRLDSSTTKCAFCDLTMVRDGNNGRFRLVLKMDWGSASIEGSSSLQACRVEIRNGRNIRVHFS